MLRIQGDKQIELSRWESPVLSWNYMNLNNYCAQQGKQILILISKHNIDKRKDTGRTVITNLDRWWTCMVKFLENHYLVKRSWTNHCMQIWKTQLQPSAIILLLEYLQNTCITLDPMRLCDWYMVLTQSSKIQWFFRVVFCIPNGWNNFHQITSNG